MSTIDDLVDAKRLDEQDATELSETIKKANYVREAMDHEGNKVMWRFMEDALNELRGEYDGVAPDDLIKLQHYVAAVREVIDMPKRFIENGINAQQFLDTKKGQEQSTRFL